MRSGSNSGANPHVVQEAAFYKCRYNFYSLGNFVFDHQIHPDTDKELILQVTVENQGLSKLREIPVKIIKGKPFPVLP